MASSTWSSRRLVTPHFKDFSGLFILRQQLLPTPKHDLLDTITAPQLTFATIVHLKSVSAHGYRQVFKHNNIADLIVSPFSTLTFYCSVAFLAFHTRTVTLCTAYALGLAISLVTFLETYNTVYAMMQRSEFIWERIRSVTAYLVCTNGPLGLVIFSFKTAPSSRLGYESSPGVDCVQKDDDAAREQQHRKERTKSETKVQLHNDLFPEYHYALKADESTKMQQDKTIPYVLNATLQHASSKAQTATYKNVTPDLETGQEPNMKTAENHWSLTTPEVQPGDSMFQMTLRKSMHRSERPRRTRSRMSISFKECSNEDSHLSEGFRMTVWSEDETGGERSGSSTPDSDGSTPESDFQAGLRMMFGSACGRRRRGMRGGKSGTSSIGSDCLNQESEFQMKFRKAVWPRTSSKRRTGTPGSETSGEESEFQAEFRAMMGLDARKRQMFYTQDSPPDCSKHPLEATTTETNHKRNQRKPTEPPQKPKPTMSLLILLSTIPLAIFGLYKFSNINKTTHQQSLFPSSPPSPLPSTPIISPLPNTPIFSTLPSPILFTANPADHDKESSRRPCAGRCNNPRSRCTKKGGRCWELWCEKQRSMRGPRVGEKRRRDYAEKGGRGGKRRREVEEEGSVF
ncbi:hypothetical protein JMJ35_002783 [Cladonia borealis]|uniref:Uncharacterized protein n=1 Tax=Cladonia borealis TaxID=184061 RepID=A0AA39R816_9LECA|nr:hypothetical protein JMJ35_002783 [Cladonia borealis]